MSEEADWFTTSHGVTGRGFQVIEFTNGRHGITQLNVQESSAIGDYEDAMENPGSSYLWVRALDNVGAKAAFELCREQATQLRDALDRWLRLERLHDTPMDRPEKEE